MFVESHLKQLQNNLDSKLRIAEELRKMQTAVTFVNLLLAWVFETQTFYIASMFVLALTAIKTFYGQGPGKGDVQKALELTSIILTLLPNRDCHSWISLHEATKVLGSLLASAIFGETQVLQGQTALLLLMELIYWTKNGERFDW